MRELVVVPRGGLCNRLRVVLSAMSFARDTGCKVVVEWGVNKECRAFFTDLFEPLIGFDFDFRIAPRKWSHRAPTRHNLHLPKMARRFAFDKEWVDFKMPTAERSFLEEAKGVKRGYLTTGYSFYPYPNELLELLKPSADIEPDIAACTSAFGDNMIGVHIRRTDNKEASRISTDNAFRNAMHEEIRDNHGALFFVATDDIALKDALRKEFPGRIMTQAIEKVRRDTIEGMQQAAIDLFCLAHTQKILGSYWSSFSDMAAEMGNVRLEVVR